ncbi:MAG: MFS transporter [Pseudomonadota bacterium]
MELQEISSLPVEIKHPTFHAFRHRNFRLFFAGQSISLIGTWSQSLAISWLVWRLTHSAAWLGIIGFAIQFPMLILGLPGGVAADRFDRLRSLTLMQVLCMLQAVILSVLTLFGVVRLWEVVVLSAMLGAVYSFEFPIRQSFVMDMVGRNDMLNAASLNAAMFHGMRIVGPMAAGFIVAWKGEGVCFLFNAATFLALIVALMMVDRKELVHVRAESAPMFDSIRGGIRHMMGEPHTKTALLLVAVISVVGMPFVNLLPIFADSIFGGRSVALGWLMGASGAGALSGALWLAKRRTSKGLLTLSARSATIFSLSTIAFSQLKVIWAASVALAVSGFFLTMVVSSVNTLIQHGTPDHLRGRMMSLFTIAFMGLAPFGSLVGGFVAQEIGAPLTVAACGAACTLAGAAIWIKARSLDRPR